MDQPVITGDARFPQWEAVNLLYGASHVVPLADLRPHVISNDVECWCHPVPSEDDDDVLCHNALDQRERVERREKLDG